MGGIRPPHECAVPSSRRPPRTVSPAPSRGATRPDRGLSANAHIGPGRTRRRSRRPCGADHGSRLADSSADRADRHRAARPLRAASETAPPAGRRPLRPGRRILPGAGRIGYGRRRQSLHLSTTQPRASGGPPPLHPAGDPALSRTHRARERAIPPLRTRRRSMAAGCPCAEMAAVGESARLRRTLSLERLSGRYARAAAEAEAPRTVHALADRGPGLDVAALARRLPRWAVWPTPPTAVPPICRWPTARPTP